MKGVLSFGKNGKLCPRYVGSYKILQRVGKVELELRLPSELARFIRYIMSPFLRSVLTIPCAFSLLKC